MRHLIHKLICWYLRRCGNVFHCYDDGWTVRYVALMTEAQYAIFQRALQAPPRNPSTAFTVDELNGRRR